MNTFCVLTKFEKILISKLKRKFQLNQEAGEQDCLNVRMYTLYSTIAVDVDSITSILSACILLHSTQYLKTNRMPKPRRIDLSCTFLLLKKKIIAVMPKQLVLILVQHLNQVVIQLEKLLYKYFSKNNLENILVNIIKFYIYFNLIILIKLK